MTSCGINTSSLPRPFSILDSICMLQRSTSWYAGDVLEFPTTLQPKSPLMSTQYIRYLYDQKVGGAESFATSISLEKLDRFVSSSCPYFFLATILGDLGSQLALFWQYSNYRIQYKGPVKKVFASKCTALKLLIFSVGRSQIEDEKID